MTSFGARLAGAMTDRGQLCVGIDPHAGLLAEWGLDATASGARDFGLRVVEAAAGRVGVVKPQVAFYERYGSAGFAALEEVIAAARAAGLVVIADAKRGDIGTTMDGYADAWLGAGSPLESDAVTISPYLGPDSLRGMIAAAVREDKGLFVLAATSNPEAAGLQSAEVTVVEADRGQTVADWVTQRAGAVNTSAAVGDDAFGPVGFVVGATVDRAELGLTDDVLHRAAILAPGFGAQGARLSDIRDLFGALAPQVLASASRSILGAGPAGIADAIDAHNAELQKALHA
ncbi:orotidine-5'-phosphate decarboxylase [Microbacterium dauci]|uniref:Orotidine 5'-phosphate decarboxylase n=1 Tax=Microbacterium dauci TaxID=3048008 RepID=A0ABT6ZC50_9MICO|nr:orotidine-5'-phosphate decarboxylase [Microbacterium sp. LX3-4]MDJ1113740.1 orotidine-5'-phosphate decarboxylase [Microbacterium sp. LX3-4]